MSDRTYIMRFKTPEVTDEASLREYHRIHQTRTFVCENCRAVTDDPHLDEEVLTDEGGHIFDETLIHMCPLCRRDISGHEIEFD